MCVRERGREEQTEREREKNETLAISIFLSLKFLNYQELDENLFPNFFLILTEIIRRSKSKITAKVSSLF